MRVLRRTGSKLTVRALESLASIRELAGAPAFAAGAGAAAKAVSKRRFRVGSHRADREGFHASSRMVRSIKPLCLELTLQVHVA